MDEWKPSREAIRALVELLPALEREPRTTWDDRPGVMPTLEPDAAEQEFIQRAYDHDWVYSFDWGAWRRWRKYAENPDLVAKAKLSTIRKLITTHIRADRICEGHFRGMRTEGHLRAILMRLRDFHEHDANAHAHVVDPTSLPPPDRSDQTYSAKREDPDDEVVYGFGDDRLRDGRPYRLESWSQYGFLLATIFLPMAGLEDATLEELLDLLVKEGVVEFLKGEPKASLQEFTDASGNDLWSINIVIGDEDGLIARHT